jgi:hypothetical protein
MENFLRNAGRSLDRRSFFRGLGKWGMGAAAVAGVLLIPKKSAAEDTPFCNNNGGPDWSCQDRPVGFEGCGKNGDGICVASGNGHCKCSRQ